MKLLRLLIALLFVNNGVELFSQEENNGYSFKVQKNCIYYDHQEKQITYEAFADSVETGMFNATIKDIADTTKFWLQKTFPDVSSIKHIEIPTSLYRGVDDEKVEIGNNQKPSIITFWSTSCTPCIRILRGLEILARDYRWSANFYAVTYDTPERIRHFLSNKENDFKYIKIVIDTERCMEKKLNIPFHPTHLIIDKNNHIVGLVTGIGSMRKIFKMLEDLI